MKKFIFIDTETTGIDPSASQLLEVAAIVTDEKFNELEVYHETIAVPEHVLSQMDEWCAKTHTASGLIAEVKARGKGLYQVEVDLISLVRRHFHVTKPEIAGSSVHFDRRFIEAHMPRLHRCLHYRIVDVSSFWIALERCHGFNLPKEDASDAHRALPDIRRSIAALKTYMEKFVA